MTNVDGQTSISSFNQTKSQEEDEDDFEKQLASFIENEEQRDQQEEKDSVLNNNNEEKGEIDKLESERLVGEDKEDDYTFTSDQQRAMDELLAQREEDDFIGEEDPPEYNVKERLLLLNAELAKDPTPLEDDHRDKRIKFKDNLVDLVAPPPDFGEDEEEPTVSINKLQNNRSSNNSDKSSSVNNNNEKSKKFVVERDGRFEVLHAEDMTSSEKKMYIVDDAVDHKSTVAYTNTTKLGNTNNSNIYNQKKPSPPSKPRPATANSSNTRRVRPSSSHPRPKSASVSLNNTSPLENFNYRSPYALSDEDKSHFKQRAKYLEDKKRQDEETKKNIEREKAQNAASIYDSWIQKKTVEDNRRRQEEREKQKSETKEDQLKTPENQYNSTLETFEPIFQTSQNEDMYKDWLKNKQNQQKNEKLLKKRQDQEMREGVVIHNRDDCEKSFKRWLRKKNAEIRRKKHAERQKIRYLRLSSRKSRKSQALARAINQSQSYKYVDYNY